MYKLSEKLDLLMKNRNYTSVKLADYLGMDKSTVNQFRTGKRKLRNKSIAEKISEALQLNHDEHKGLMSAFYSDAIGEYYFRGINAINDIVCNSSWINCPVAYRITDTSIKMDKPSVVLEGKYNVDRIIGDLIICEGRSSKEVYVCESLINDDTCAAIEALCRCEEQAKIFHVFSWNDAVNSELENNMYNVDSLKKILRLITYGKNYKPRYYYSSRSSTMMQGDFISNTLIVGNYVLCYSANHQYGILTQNNKEFLGMQKKIVTNCYSEANVFASTLNYAEYLERVTAILKVGNQKKVRAFTPGICMGLILDEKETLLARHVQEDFPGKDIWIQSIHQYLGNIQSLKDDKTVSGIIFSSLKGMNYTTRKGYINEIPGSLYEPLSLEERIEFLRKWKAAIKTYDIAIMDIPEMEENAFMELYVLPSEVLLALSMPNGEAICIDLKDPGMIELMLKYVEFNDEYRQMSPPDVDRKIDSLVEALKDEIRETVA